MQGIARQGAAQPYPPPDTGRNTTVGRFKCSVLFVDDEPALTQLAKGLLSADYDLRCAGKAPRRPSFCSCATTSTLLFPISSSPAYKESRFSNGLANIPRGPCGS